MDPKLASALGEGALLVRPVMATAVVTGPERTDWLNGLVTCELAKRGPGDGAYGLSVSKQGKLQSELWIVLTEQRIIAGLTLDTAEEVVAQLDRHLIMEDAEIALERDPHTWILGLGALAPALVAAARGRGADAAVIRRASTDVAVAVCAADEADGTVEAMLAAAGPHGLVASDEQWQRVRVELGIPTLGVDFAIDDYPQEASLEGDGVSFDKGCYLGQEAVFMLQHRGHPKTRLVQLAGEAQPLPTPGARVELPDGTDVGSVTSVVGDPSSTGWLGLASVKYKHAAPGTKLRVGALDAIVTTRLSG